MLSHTTNALFGVSFLATLSRKHRKYYATQLVRDVQGIHNAVAYKLILIVVCAVIYQRLKLQPKYSAEAKNF